ncbi:MAG TPA: hypothetical protein VN641_03845 [Urbifossiella sp.]|nr:hypothetical protein [Urbifossiella sp.]
MQYEEENRVNQAAYKRMRSEIDSNYPKGRFIGFADGKIVADAETFDAIDEKLNELGFEPLKTMVVIAGDDTPEYVDILSPILKNIFQ